MSRIGERLRSLGGLLKGVLAALLVAVSTTGWAAYLGGEWFEFYNTAKDRMLMNWGDVDLKACEIAIPVYDVGEDETVTPVVIPGTVKGFSSCKVYTDEWMFDRLLGEWTKGVVWGEECDEEESYFWYETKACEYEVDLRLWGSPYSGPRPNPSRRWIVLKAKSAAEWGGALTFKVGLSETDEIAEYSLRSTCNGIFPGLKAADFFNRVTFGRYWTDDDFCVEAWSLNDIPAHVVVVEPKDEDLCCGLKPSFTVTLPGPGTLVVRGVSPDEFERFDFRATSGKNPEVSYENYSDTGLGYTAGTILVRVDAKCTLMCEDRWGDAPALGASSWSFYPREAKSVAVVAALADLDDTGAAVSGALLKGYVKGTGTYKVGETVKLTAVSGGAAFGGWEVIGGELPSGTDLTKPTLTFKVPEWMAGTEDDACLVGVRAVWIDYPLVQPIPLPLTGGTVTGGGAFKPGSKVALKATPAKGFFFAGWYRDGEPFRPEGAPDYRNATLNYLADEEGGVLSARFIGPGEDYLYYDGETEVRLDLNMDVADMCAIFEGFYSESLPTVTAKDLPAGLKWDAKTNCLTGRPTKAGVYYATFAAKNVSGYQFTAVVKFVVGGAQEVFGDDLPSDVDLSFLEDLWVGNPVDAAIPSDLKVAFKGLPAGLKVEKEEQTDDFGRLCDSVLGQPTKAGAFLVTVTMKDPDNPKVTLTRKVTAVVHDYGSRYVAVVADGDGAASGSGVYPVGATVKLSAKPGKDQVFAGWHGDDGAPYQAEYGSDYRNPSVSFVLTADCPETLFAAFCAKARDDEIAYIGPALDDGIWTIDQNKFSPKFKFSISSGSLPKITLKGLPAGVTFGGEKDCEMVDTSSDWPGDTVWYRLRVDSKKPPKPGVYPVTISAENQSKTKMAPVTVKIRMPNLVCDGIRVEDSYGPFDPGVELQPGELVIDEAAGCAVSGLPSGFKWNDKVSVDKKTGAETPANSVTGACTKPGSYTVYFTKKIGKETLTATSTFVVKDYPRLDVVLAGGGVGGKVAGSGNYPANKKVALKATADKGYVFAGWYLDLDFEDPLEMEDGDYRNPALNLVTGAADTSLYARFVPLKEDCIRIDVDPEETYYLSVGEYVEIWLDDIFESVSLPAFTVNGLPAGLKYDAKTLRISGVPTKSGWFTPTVAVKNAGGYTCTYVLRMGVDCEDPAEDYHGRWIYTEDGGTYEEESDGDERNGLRAILGVEGPWGRMTTDRYFVANEAPLATVESLVRTYAEDGYKMSEKETDTFAVSGLPAGLKLTSRSWKNTWKDSGESETVTTTEYYLTGVPTKPGRYTVTMTETYSREHSESCPGEPAYNNKSTEKYIAQFDIYVDQPVSRYIDVVVVPGTDGRVHGTAGTAGVYAAGAVVKSTAKAGKGYVFAGWYEDEAFEEEAWNRYAVYAQDKDGDGKIAAQTWFNGTFVVPFPRYCEGDEEEGAPTYSYTFSEYSMPANLCARFIPVEQDMGVRIDLYGSSWHESPCGPVVIESVVHIEEGAEWNFLSVPELNVYAESFDPTGASELSGSLAVVTDVKGLPKGLVTAKDGESGIYAVYRKDRSTPVPPGRYQLAFAAKNQSGATATRTLTLVVGNEINSFFADYGLDQSEEGYHVQIGSCEGGMLEGLAYTLSEIAWECGSVSLTGLPTGLSFKKDTYGDCYFTGTPTKPGTYTVTASATDWWGWKQTATFFITVDPLPSWLVGNFAGGMREDWYNDRAHTSWDCTDYTLFNLTVSDTGKVTVKVQGIDSDDGYRTLTTPAFVAELTWYDEYEAEVRIYDRNDEDDNSYIYLYNDEWAGVPVGRGELGFDDWSKGYSLLSQDIWSRPENKGYLKNVGLATTAGFTLRESYMKEFDGAQVTVTEAGAVKLKLAGSSFSASGTLVPGDKTVASGGLMCFLIVKVGSVYKPIRLNFLDDGNGGWSVYVSLFDGATPMGF